MKIVDPTVPSLYVPDGFCVSIHRTQYAWESKSLSLGQSITLNLPSLFDWYTAEIEYMYMDVDSNKIVVDGALLDSSYQTYYGGTFYGYSYWRPYNQTIRIVNNSTDTLSIQISMRTDFFRLINHEIAGQFLNFTLDSTAFNSVYAGEYVRLDIAADSLLNSSILYVPDGNDAKALYQILGDYYSTLEVVGGTYRVSINPYYAWQVLYSDIYGTWSLKLPTVEGVHDVAVECVNPFRTVVDHNCTTEMNVTVLNQGSFTENFNVSAYAGMHLIGTQILTLAGGESANVTFAWNTAETPMSPLPTECTLSAVANAVQNETITDNNNATCFVKISIKGDVDADGIVSIVDLTTAAIAFERIEGDPMYAMYVNADVNEDKIIDIVDITFMALEFDKTA